MTLFTFDEGSTMDRVLAAALTKYTIPTDRAATAAAAAAVTASSAGPAESEAVVMQSSLSTLSGM